MQIRWKNHFRIRFTETLLICWKLSWISLQKTWCVARPSSDQATLLANINYACSHVDCRIMQKGCPCFYPDSLISHASIAMSLYYHSQGKNQWNCDFRGSGLIVITDPSQSDFNTEWIFLLILFVVLRFDLWFDFAAGFGNCLYPWIEVQEAITLLKSKFCC